ncbi:MAG: hypothetical protein JWN32_4534 [Solirubrobacterales bacterium]|jgi:uncharacterized membrane protein YeaQ/YmgE (transglycosylase-associated protein family)|nr:hypothetical protein [Solirubrobacterales bacterium]
MIGLIIYSLIVGLVVGALARLALPGPDPMGIGATILLGIAGSVVAGVVSWLLFGHVAGFILSVAGATLILYGIRRSRGGSLTRPGRRSLPH